MQERVLTPPFIVSMSPPEYPSAWLRPRSARFRFARQDHCSSAACCDLTFRISRHPTTILIPRTPARYNFYALDYRNSVGSLGP